MKINTVTHKEIEIEINYNTQTNCFSAYSQLGSSNNPFDSELNNFCHGFETPAQAVNSCMIKIDEYLDNSPKTYTELAERITDSLVWTGYEDCHADENTIRILVDMFNKFKNK